MHYTLEELKQKSLKELKEIGYQLNVLPEGDRRYARNWVKALVGKQPPLLQLLEASPAEEAEEAECSECGGDKFICDAEGFYVECPLCNGSGFETEFAQEAIEPQLVLTTGIPAVENSPGVSFDPEEFRQTHEVEIEGYFQSFIKVQTQEPPLESKFGRIVYPRPIAQNAETQPQFPGTESADVCNRRSHPAESVRDSGSAETEALGSEEGDRVLAVAGNHQAGRGGVLPHQPTELITHYEELDRPPNRGDGKGRIESEPKVSQSALAKPSKRIASAAKNSPGVESDLNPILTGVAFSDRFLATYPPYFGEVHYKAEADTGQLNLLQPLTDDEPPDPDDFSSIDAFREAMARWDAENAETLTISMDSMCEWAPCPDDWYEPEAGIMQPKVPSMREVMEVAPTSSDRLPSSSDHSDICKCWNFSIPTFDAWCDRANRQTDSDEPPDTGIFARLPKPKPPSFPPMASQPQVSLSQVKSGQVSQYRKLAESLPKLFHRVAAGSSQSGRAPPGGDAHF